MPLLLILLMSFLMSLLLIRSFRRLSLTNTSFANSFLNISFGNITPNTLSFGDISPDTLSNLSLINSASDNYLNVDIIPTDVTVAKISPTNSFTYLPSTLKLKR